MQGSLFPPLIRDDLGRLGRGVTNPRLVRADDGLVYVIKADCAQAPTCRASEFIWLSLARAVGLAAPAPVVIADAQSNTYLGMRYEAERIKEQGIAANAMLAGEIRDGGEQLSKILAFDLFSGNWDRHAENYLVLESHGQRVVMAIDFSHVPPNPGDISSQTDPTIVLRCATRMYFPIVSKPYLQGAAAHRVALAAAVETLDRFEKISDSDVNSILGNFPSDWLSKPDRTGVAQWWTSQARIARIDQLRMGMKNGSYL